MEPIRLLCEKGHPIELCTCEPIITEVGRWKKFDKEKPKHGQMILYKERWFYWRLFTANERSISGYHIRTN